LLHEREKIGYTPVLGNLAVAHAHHVDGLELDSPACRGAAEELTLMRAMVSLVRRHAIAIGKLPMNVGVEVREGGPENLVEFSGASLIWRAPRLRRMVEEIVGKELLEYIEIAAALHFLGIPSNDRLRSFARAELGHDLPLLILRALYRLRHRG